MLRPSWKMARLRRSRLLIVCAVVLVFLFYHLSQHDAWDNPLTYGSLTKPHERPPPPPKAAHELEEQGVRPIVEAKPPTGPVKVHKEDTHPPTLKSSLEQNGAKGAYGHHAPVNTGARAQLITSTAVISADIPTQTIGGPPLFKPTTSTSADAANPAKHTVLINTSDLWPSSLLDKWPFAKTSTSTAHWEKPTEYFPVPDEYLIRLPTGKPKSMPQVQFDFGPEKQDKKEMRLERLAKVKSEMARAWDGYTTYAFGHDELMPVSNTSRDPFCGWAATLVDSLDTLWIMGMKEEFDVAYKGLEDIDFTTSPRSEIPVFETTIRYLGGLLAAYDVTGGHMGDYPLLLKKAVELAEILMGVFDTPNRMPILYYNWRPDSTNSPHRAAQGASIAEMGSLAMEFTRLAQLTGKDKYYDAVARITDGLEDWQIREGNTAAMIPGIFPERVDLSGCNNTIPILPPPMLQTFPAVDEFSTLADEPQGYRASIDDADKRLSRHEEDEKWIPGKNIGGEGIRIVDGKARAVHQKRSVVIDSPDLDERSAEVVDADPYRGKKAFSIQTAQASAEPSTTVRTTTTSMMPTMSYPNLPARTNMPNGWECVTQNMTTGGYGSDAFSMGGSQDSTYEYFPKQHILLGGLVPKYREMHERVAAAVKKHLLFRPMTKDDEDILFSAKILARGTNESSWSYDYEVTHLTCFLGGMFALGGKLFNSPEDVEIGAKLTDGCIWAYNVMPSGIMPEYARVLPCKDAKHCSWNETAWRDALDPTWDYRADAFANYEVEYAKWEVETAAIKQQTVLAEERRASGLQLAALDNVPSQPDALIGHKPHTYDGNKGTDVENLATQRAQREATDKTLHSSPIAYKRSLGAVEQGEEEASDGAPPPPPLALPPPAVKLRNNNILGQDNNEFPPPRSTTDREAIEKKIALLEKEMEANAAVIGHTSEVLSPPVGSYGGPPSRPGAEVAAAGGGRGGRGGSNVAQVPIEQNAVTAVYPLEPVRPQTHDEYVDERIETEKLPGGFVLMQDKRYILRPEAIESVWYMYRITGDTSWQDKGWRMFQAVINATSLPSGHSAIDDVTAPAGNYTMLDNMESFWQAETLKYYYLLFAEPDVISLDEWVLNTEAHPFRRPV